MKGKKKHEFRDGEQGSALAVHVKMTRGKSCFSKVLKDGSVVVKLSQGAGPINSRLIDFLSTELDLSKDTLQILAGEDGNRKLISIIDMKPKQIQKRILKKIA